MSSLYVSGLHSEFIALPELLFVLRSVNLDASVSRSHCYYWDSLKGESVVPLGFVRSASLVSFNLAQIKEEEVYLIKVLLQIRAIYEVQ